MSGTCSLFPPFGDPWPSCLLPSQQCGRSGFDPFVGKNPWRRKWQPTPVFLPGESPWQRSLSRYSPGIAKLPTQLNAFYLVTHSLLCGREGLSVPSTSQRGALNLNMEAWTTLGSSLHRRNCNNLRFLVASTPNRCASAPVLS